MSGTTTYEGYPYPSLTDFADVQDAFRLASAIDSDLRTVESPMRAFLGRPSFIARSTSAGSSITTGSALLQLGATEWDNTGGVASNQWVQPNAQGPSWWLFGANLILSNTGTPTIGDMRIGQLVTSTTDQVTGLSTSTTFWQRNDDSNTNGEWIQLFAMAAIYRGNVYAQLQASGVSTAIAAGSRLWGMYLGPVT